MTAAVPFAGWCQEEARALAGLRSVLVAESEALDAREPARIEALAAEKARLVEALSALAARRGAWMQEAGLDSREALTTWLADQPVERDAWGALEQSAAEVRDLNARNGQLIDARLALTNEALTLLREAAAATLGYTREGAKPDLPGGGRHLGSA